MFRVKIIARAITIILGVTLLASGIEAAESPAAAGGGGDIPELDCIIEPSEIVDIGSAVPGVVESILADRNDQVAKGTIIAQLESSVERAALELSRERANLNTAIELRQEGARFGHLTQNRNSSLLQTAAISKHELDTVVSETRIAELQVRQELDNKRIAGLELLRAEAMLDRRTIRSPVDGVVTERFKSAGEYIDDEPVMRVAQLDPLHVEVIVSTDYLGRIKPGMQAQVTPTIPEADTFMATVERVDRVSDAASGTYGVRLNLANPGYRIPAGLRCRLGFVPQMQADVAAVAEAAGNPVDTEATEIATVAESLKATEDAMVDGAAKLMDVEAVAEVSEDTLVVETEEVAVPIPVKTVEMAVAADEPGAPKSTEQAVAAVQDTAVSDSMLPTRDSTLDFELVPVSKKEQPGSCHTIGPFSRESIARRWFDGLQEVSQNLTLRNETQSVEGDFIVLASVEPTPEALEMLLDRLDRAGITDRYHFRSGVRKGSVSLGLYSNHGTAVKRQQELAEKGFASEVTPRSVTNKQYWWLDLSLPAGADLPKWVSQLPARSSVKSVICPAQFAQR